MRGSRLYFERRLFALVAGAAIVGCLALSSRPVAASGRTVMVGGSLQAAVDAANPGDVLILRTATYAGPVTITRSGAAGIPITVQGAGVGKSILAGELRLRGNVAFWQIQDLDVDASGAGDGVRIEAAHDVSLRRLHLYGGAGYGVRIGSDTNNTLVEDSEIDHFSAGMADAHGVGIMTARNVTIRGCNIHHNSGDSIQVNTPDYPGYGRFASGILIEGNRLHEDRENGLDIKSTRGLVARDNQLWGFGAVSTSDGMAIQVQYDAQDISIVSNQVWGAVVGIEVSRGRKNGVAYPLAPRRVLIAGNLFHDLVAPTGATAASVASSGKFNIFLPIVQNSSADTGAGDSGNGSGIVVRGSVGVRVYNNTVLAAPRMGLYLASSGQGDYPSDLDVRNNVLQGGRDDLSYSFALDTITNLTIDYNHYVNSRVKHMALANWLALGYERHATSGDPRLDATRRPRADSPLRDSGVNLGLPFAGAAPDRGWGEIP
jgi:hypothetical protein